MATATLDRTGTRPRTPGMVNGIVALVMVLLLAAVALTARQPPPPSIAEFAPQATEQIKDAPPEQSSKFGSGPGGDGIGEGGPPTTIPKPREIIDRARVRRCIGDPPRQIEDPQSPPCVPYFDGDNGGATTKGVTEGEIRVAIPTNLGTQADVNELSAFFNNRFEFYGRKLNLLFYRTQAQTIPEMLADAQTVDDMNVFANLAYSGGAFKDLGGREYHFFNELSRRKIVSVMGFFNNMPISDQAHLTANAPYQWTYMPTVDQIQRGIGDLACQSLVGKKPEYGGVGTSNLPVRKFGIIQTTYDDGTPSADVKPLTERLEGCGAKPFVVQYPGGGRNAEPGIILKLKDAGVTTVVALTHPGPLGTFMSSATSNAYNPEWLVSNYIGQDGDIAGATYPPAQAANVIGVRSLNKPGPDSDAPWYWAHKEANPTFSTSGELGQGDFLYWNLLVLASGIQMAGPKLTPASFEAGLFKTKFPNPGAAGPPYYQGTVGFAPGDHSMVDDFATIWWDGTARSFERYGDAAGAFCYVDRGVRFAPTKRPAGPTNFRKQPCY